MRAWHSIRMGLLIVPLVFSGLACSDAGGNSDGNDLDGEVDGDVDPCQAAAPLWNEIWSIQQEETGLEGVTPDINLMDVWGAGPDDVFVVGFAGTILRNTGTGWVQMQSGTTANLEGVWGYELTDENGAVTRTDVFAAGQDGTILRFNGTAWAPMLVVNDPDPVNNPDPQPVTGHFHDIWGIPANGTGPDDHPYVVAVGGEGLIVRYDGVNNRFVEMRSREEFHYTDADGVEQVRVSWVRFTAERLGGVYGVGSLGDPLFVAVGNNGTIVELSGDTWNRNQTFSPPGAFIDHLNGVWGRGAWEIFATGIEGTVIRRDNGGTWHILKKENALWQLSPIYLRGTWSFYQSYCGEVPEVPDGGEPPEEEIRDDTSWVIFVGWNGTVLMGHDGIICELDMPTENRLEAIWGQPPRNEDDRWVDGGSADGGVECDPVELVISGVNGTVIRLSNPEGR